MSIDYTYIAAKEEELKNSNEDPTPFKQAAEAARAQITAKQLSDLNLILTKASPQKARRSNGGPRRHLERLQPGDQHRC